MGRLNQIIWIILVLVVSVTYAENDTSEFFSGRIQYLDEFLDEEVLQRLKATEIGRQKLEDEKKELEQAFDRIENNPKLNEKKEYYIDLSKRSSAKRLSLLYKKAPEFWKGLKWIGDTQYSEAGFNGKVILLNFWGIHCRPCKREIPELNKLYKRYAKKEFVIIGISSSRKKKEIISFIKQNKILYPMAVTYQNIGMELFGVHGIPHNVLIDKKGVVRFYQMGYTGKKSIKGIKKMIKNLLKEWGSLYI